MSYEPYTWQDGDILSAARLNRMEQGIANAGADSILVVTLQAVPNSDTLIANHTAGEIISTMQSGGVCLVSILSDNQYMSDFILYGGRILTTYNANFSCQCLSDSDTSWSNEGIQK